MSPLQYDLWYVVSRRLYTEVLSLLEKGANANLKYAGGTVLCVAFVRTSWDYY